MYACFLSTITVGSGALGHLGLLQQSEKATLLILSGLCWGQYLIPGDLTPEQEPNFSHEITQEQRPGIY